MSLPFDTRWSIFSTGLQTRPGQASDIVDAVPPAAPPPRSAAPTANGAGPAATVSGGKTQLADGMQIFSGGVPIYRGNTLVGGIGVSGDGIQQDSLISYLGLQDGPTTAQQRPRRDPRRPLVAGRGQSALRQLPAAPFLNSTVQNPC